MTPLFQHILFPVDFSDRCNTQLPGVESMARNFEAKLTLLHVVQIPAAFYGAGDGLPPTYFDVPAAMEEARKQLDAFGPANSTKVERAVMQGDPASSITAYATEHGVDLIMIPTHGYGKFRSLLLGSVTAKVLDDTACPVWTSAHLAQPDPRNIAEVRNILCAVDEWPEAVRVLEKASEVAGFFRAHLVVLHAVDITSGHFLREREDVTNFLRQVATDHVAGLLDKAHVRAETVIADCGVARAVREQAEERKTDLVIIGRGVRNHPFGHLRSASYAIIRESPCPVLSF